VLQCVAACCSVLQCVAVCCSVLQCVAVWETGETIAISEGSVISAGKKNKCGSATGKTSRFFMYHV